MFTDSHCHLYSPEFHERIDEIQAAMQAEQVDRALCVCTTLDEFEGVHNLAKRYDNLWCTVGEHPDNEGIQEADVNTLVQLGSLPRVVAIGETGLDYYDMPGRKGGRSIEDMQWQRDRFRVHIQAARQLQKPLVIHTRDSAEATMEILLQEGEDGKNNLAGGVFHCYGEDIPFARRVLDMGYYISFSGIVTFKNAHTLKEVARFVPLERMLIETDSPYLAPVPFRGKTNNPSYVAYVARCIAELRGVDVVEIGQATSQNFETLFSGVCEA